VQRLSDAILDSAAKQAAKQQQMNIELSKGLFRTRIAATPTTASSSTVQPLPSAQIKQREQNNTLAQLQAMLAKVDALKEAGKL
jgi:type IV secretory pathway protease TraF